MKKLIITIASFLIAFNIQAEDTTNPNSEVMTQTNAESVNYPTKELAELMAESKQWPDDIKQYLSQVTNEDTEVNHPTANKAKNCYTQFGSPNDSRAFRRKQSERNAAGCSNQHLLLGRLLTKDHSINLIRNTFQLIANSESSAYYFLVFCGGETKKESFASCLDEMVIQKGVLNQDHN